MSKINVFVASPGDVDLERDAVAKVVNEVNFALAIIAPEKDTSLELKQWKTHVHPEMGRPQGVINKQIGSYDIFIGLMWKRFGTATGVANSGTEEGIFGTLTRNGRKQAGPAFCSLFLPRAVYRRVQ